MFRFSIRDVLWLMVVVGVVLTAITERYRSASLQSELWESASKVKDCEERFVLLALSWQARAPEMITIGEEEIEIKTGNSFRLSSFEVRLIKAHQYTRHSFYPHKYPLPDRP